MLVDGASMAIASIWSSITNWSTPTVLFCVLNLMIAIIFLASNFKPPNHQNNHNSPSQLSRSPSLLDRVKSVNLSSFYTSHESHDHHQYTEWVNSETTESNSASQLSRPSSFLQRVKSSFHNSFPTESERVNSTSELTRSPSLLDRVKSFKLGSSRFTSDHHSGDSISNVDEHSDVDPHQDLVEDHRKVTGEQSFETSGETPVKRSPGNLLKSRSDTSGETPEKRSPGNLLKSRSDKRVVAKDDGGEEDVYQRRPATMKAAVVVRDESVDSKAEDFIKRFKQQLKLQRLDSLQRLKEMLNRGTSSA